MHPIQISIEQLKITDVKKEEPTCPITLMPFIRPWILLEDGFTYEKHVIENWLMSHPNNSPLIGDIPSATLLPNCTIKNEEVLCPITKEPFQEPYYCVEDGYTYEKEAILKWVELRIKENLEQGPSSSLTFKSPASGVELNRVTLYPNKILFKKKMPKECNPIVFGMDIGKISFKNLKSEFKCIFNSEIRSLIKTYVDEKDYEKQEKIKKQIDTHRILLGLDVKESASAIGTLDLSHLDLSHMDFLGLEQKGSIVEEADLSHSFFQNCSFSRCRFLNCKMQKAFFINCNFMGEQVSFFGTDMKEAIIDDRCRLEKGSTWQRITNWSDFKIELSARGALNADSIILRSSLF